MDKSIFKISKMDCPSEESMIRMKLDSVGRISKLDFDIPNRKLTVLHNGNLEEIQKAIADLKFNEELISSEPTDEVIAEEASNQSRLLWSVLIINFIFLSLK